MTIDNAYFSIKSNKSTPLYAQIQENIAELIKTRMLEDGIMLPSERDLSQIYDVNRLTVRKAIEGLVLTGLVRKQHGVGNFVQRKTELKLSAKGFTQRMYEEGLTPSSRMISARLVKPPMSAARQLNIGQDDLVFSIERIRLADDEPIMIETIYLPAKRFPNLLDYDLERNSLYHLLEIEYQTTLLTTEQTLEPILLDEYEAQLFKLKEGYPAMLVRIIAYDTAHKPIEVGKSLIRGDRCRFYFRIQTQQPLIT